MADEFEIQRKRQLEEIRLAESNEIQRQGRIATGERMITTSPQDFNHLAEDSGTNIPERYKKDFQDKANKGISLTEGNEGSPLKQMFAKGIAEFLPTVVAAAFGGTKGVAQVAGSQAQILKASRSPKSGKVDITPDFVIKGTNEPVFTKEQPDGSVKFMNQNKEVIDAKNVESLKAMEQRTRAEGVQSRFEGRMTQAQFNATESFLKNFEKQHDKVKSQIDSMDGVIDTLEAGQPITTDQIATFNARGIFDEVGRLSDDDVRRARVPLDIYKRIKNSISESLSGNASSEAREVATKLITFVSNRKREKLDRDIKKQANKNRSKRFGISSAEELQEEIRNQMGVSLKKREPRKKKKEIDNNLQNEINSIKKELSGRGK